MTQQQEAWFKQAFTEELSESLRQIFRKRLSDDDGRAIWIAYFGTEHGISLVYDLAQWRESSLRNKGLAKAIKVYERTITDFEERCEHLCILRLRTRHYDKSEWEGFRKDEMSCISNLITQQELFTACKPYFQTN